MFLPLCQAFKLFDNARFIEGVENSVSAVRNTAHRRFDEDFIHENKQYLKIHFPGSL